MADPDPAPPPLPDLYEGTLDADLLDRLGADLSACAEIEYVQVRGADGDRRTSLEAAIQMLSSGDVRTIQIRYHHADADWCDTLFAQPAGGFRLVRMQSNPSPRNPDVDRH